MCLVSNFLAFSYSENNNNKMNEQQCFIAQNNHLRTVQRYQRLWYAVHHRDKCVH